MGCIGVRVFPDQAQSMEPEVCWKDEKKNGMVLQVMTDVIVREKKAAVEPVLQSSTPPLSCCSTYVRPARALLAHHAGPPLSLYRPSSSAARRMTVSFSRLPPSHFPSISSSHDISFISAWTARYSLHLSPPISPSPNLARFLCSAIHLSQYLARTANVPVFSFINTFAFICFRTLWVAFSVFPSFTWFQM